MLIIRCNAIIKEVDQRVLWMNLRAMVRTGVVLLPAYCELLNEVPPDEEVVVIKKKE